MKKVHLFLLCFIWALTISAQIVDPVRFTSELKLLKNAEAEILFHGTIDAGWHVYSPGLGEDGPISASFNTVKMEGAKPVGKLQARGREIKQFDNMFDMELRYFEKAVTFVQKVKFTKSDYDIDCFVEYGACNDEMCIPPTQAEFRQKGKVALPTEENTDTEEKAP